MLKLRTAYRDIVSIIPEGRRKTLRKFAYASILFSLLDLLSVAYLIPAVLLLLDRQKLSTYIEHNLPWVDTNNPMIILGAVTLLILIYLFKNIFQAKFNSALYRFLYRLSCELSVNLLRIHVEGDYLAQQYQEKGHFLQRITTACRDFATSLLAPAILLISEGLTFLVILAAMLICYFELTFVTLFATGIFSWMVYRTKKKEFALINTKYKTATAKANSELINIMDGYMEIKMSGTAKKFTSHYASARKELDDASALLAATSANYSKYLEIFLIGGAAALISCSVLIPWGRHTLVLVSVLAALSIKIIPSLNKILNAITMVNSHLYTIDLLRQERAVNLVLRRYDSFLTSLAFKDIRFGYADGKPIFEHLDFKLQKGQLVGINGVTGAGKTTFLHLVAGLITPAKGNIYLDGKALDPGYFLSFVAYVPQQPTVFHGTVLENITMRQDQATIDYAYIDFLIEKLSLVMLYALPQGLETLLQHNTSLLSGGQKQRLALLRALYRKPQLLVLDEATNQQHESMESDIYALIRNLAINEKLTILTVTHNPKIASFCDRVFTMEDSTLKEI